MQFDHASLSLLQETAVKAAGATIVAKDGDGRLSHVAIGGELKTIVVKPPLITHHVETLEALATFAVETASRWKDSLESPGLCVKGRPVIFHNAAGVVLLLDDLDRRDCVVMSLEVSDKWNTLALWNKHKPTLTQKEAVGTLRLIFNAAPNMIDRFRKLDLKTGQTINARVDRGRESLGKAVEAEIMNAADIPETITLQAPIYENLGEDTIYDVACMVEIDPVNGLIQIVPEPQRLQEIIHRHQASIAERLEAAFADVEGGIPVYYGKP